LCKLKFFDLFRYYLDIKMGNYIFKLYLVLLFVSVELLATSITVDNSTHRLSLLEHSEVVFDNSSLELKELLDKKL